MYSHPSLNEGFHPSVLTLSLTVIIRCGTVVLLYTNRTPTRGQRRAVFPQYSSPMATVYPNLVVYIEYYSIKYEHADTETDQYMLWGKKLHPFYFFFNNFVKSSSILIIFGAQILDGIQGFNVPLDTVTNT